MKADAIFSESAARDLREGRTERLTSESFAVIRVIKIAHQLHGLASAALRDSVSDAAESEAPSYFPESLCWFCKASLFPSRLRDNNHRRDAERSGKNSGPMNR